MNWELSNQELLELDELCGRFEREWRPNSELLQEYLSKASDRQLPFLVRELVSLECELLRSKGEEPRCETYRQRLPQWQGDIDAACKECILSSGVSEPKPLRPRQLGDYRILREIGRGSSGIVYEAEQKSLGRTVAIKVLTSYALLIPEAVERFQRESRAVAALHHSNIVQVYGTGKQDGLHYFAMQLVDGMSIERLTRELREGTRGGTKNDDLEHLLSPKQARWSHVANIGLQVASALSYAHGQGILHRDIKPANLLFDGDTVWVTDFGLAKIHQEESNVTQTGDLVGTLRYLPPEAVTGTWDERGDVYGLGLTLYELLMLRPAFAERDRSVLLNRITDGEPPVSPRELDGAIPRDIDTIIMKAIACEPIDRYQSADELARDLRLLLDGEPIVARRPDAFERLWKWSRKKPALAALFAVVAFVATVGFPTVASLWLSAEAAKKTAEDERDFSNAVGYASSMQLAQSSIEQRKPNEVRSLLNHWSDSSKQIIGRGSETRSLPWEWNYLNSQVNASTRIVGTLEGPAFSIAVRADGKQIATASTQKLADVGHHQSRLITIWDLASGKATHELEGSKSGVTSISYSPDGRWLATIGRDKQVRIWDTNTAEVAQDLLAPTHDLELQVSTRRVYPPLVSFSSNGRWLVCSTNPLIVFDTCSWKVLSQFKGHVGGLVPNSDQLLAFVGKSGTLYDLESLESVATFTSPHAVTEISFSSDGKRLCTSSDRGFHLRTLPSFEIEHSMDARDVYWSSLSPDGKQVVHVDQSGVLQVRQIENVEPPKLLMGHQGMLRDGAYLPGSSRLFTCGDDGTLREWNTRHTPWKRVVRSKKLTNDLLGDLAFAPDGKSVLCVSRWDPGEDAGRLLRFNIDDGLSTLSNQPAMEQVSFLQLTTRAKWPRTDFAFSHNGKWLALPAPEEPHPGKQVIIGDAESGRVNIWNTDTQQIVRSFKLPSNRITSLAWSRDDTELAVASFGEESTVSIYDVVRLDDVVPSESLLTTKDEHQDAEPSASRLALSVGKKPVSAVSFNNSGTWLATSTEQEIAIWDLGADKVASHTFAQTESASFLDWSAGDLLAASYKNANLVRVFDASEMKMHYEIPGPRSPTCVRFAPGGDRFAIVGYDSLVHLCETRHGRRVLTLHGSNAHAGKTSLTARCAFSRDGRRLATNDWKGRITIWEASSD